MILDDAMHVDIVRPVVCCACIRKRTHTYHIYSFVAFLCLQHKLSFTLIAQLVCLLDFLGKYNLLTYFCMVRR